MERRFAALRVIGTISKIVAWIALILGALASLLILVLGLTTTQPLGLVDLEVAPALVGVAGFVVTLTLAIIIFLLFYGAGEFLYMFLSIEESSRRTAYLMQQQYLAQPTAYAPSPATNEYVE
jgi:hypothetical protein